MLKVSQWKQIIGLTRSLHNSQSDRMSEWVHEHISRVAISWFIHDNENDGES